MFVRFSDLDDGKCFLKRSKLKKKVNASTEATIDARGRVRRRKVRGDPVVEPLDACPLPYLGLGLTGMPNQILELGRGRRPCR